MSAKLAMVGDVLRLVLALAGLFIICGGTMVFILGGSFFGSIGSIMFEIGIAAIVVMPVVLGLALVLAGPVLAAVHYRRRH